MISHGRLAFCTATKILLAFISRAAGSTYTTARKSDNKEKMFWKVTLPSALISAKDTRTIKVTFKTVGRVIDPDIQRSNVSCVLFPWLRVCFFSFFLSFLFLFLPTFIIFSPLPLPLLS